MLHAQSRENNVCAPYLAPAQGLCQQADEVSAPVTMILPPSTSPGMPPWRGWRSEGKCALEARHLRKCQRWRALSSANSADRFSRHAAVARVATAFASVPQRTAAAVATTASGTVGMLQEAHRTAAKQVSSSQIGSLLNQGVHGALSPQAAKWTCCRRRAARLPRRSVSTQIRPDTFRQIRHGVLFDTKQRSPNCTRQALLLVFAAPARLGGARLHEAGRCPSRGAGRQDACWPRGGARQRAVGGDGVRASKGQFDKSTAERYAD